MAEDVYWPTVGRECMCIDRSLAAEGGPSFMQVCTITEVVVIDGIDALLLDVRPGHRVHIAVAGHGDYLYCARCYFEPLQKLPPEEADNEIKAPKQKEPAR